MSLVWKAVVLCCALVGVSCVPKPQQALISLGLSQSSAVSGSAWALLSISAAEANYAEKITITFQRVMQENATARQQDFIGLYFKDDANIHDPWNWESVNATLEAGKVVLQANKAGDMELRLVRPPNQILARVGLLVYKPCNPLCYRHGACVKGECVCNDGYAEPNCVSPEGDEVILEAFDKDGLKEFQKNLPITARFSWNFPVEMNGRDYVGVYTAGSPNGTAALSWQSLPAGNVTSIDLKGVKTPGQYVLRLTRYEDLHVIAESKPFTVFEYCPRQCSNHGKCVGGHCACDAGYSLDDCSVGLGMVNISVVFGPDSKDLHKDDEVQIKFSRVFDSDHPNILGDSDWIGMFDANDTTWEHPFAYQYAQMDPDTAQSDIQTGSVQFVVPPQPEYLVFKYIRNDHIVLAESARAHVYQPCRFANCSDHGKCVDAVCVCNVGWTGEGCQIGDVDCELMFNKENLLVRDPIAVSFAHGVANGTSHDFIGLYFADSVNNTVGLKDWKLANITSNFGGPAKNIASGVATLSAPAPGKYQLRYVDIFDKTTMCASHEFEVFPRCPRDCSGDHGTCLQGKCKCGEQWLLPDCKRHVGTLTVSAPERVVLNSNIAIKTNITAVVNLPEGWHNTADFVGLYPTSEDPLSPITPSMVFSYQIVPSQTGEIKLQLSVASVLQPAKYQLWYVNGIDYSKVATSEPFEIVPNCGPGSYKLDTHKCQCPQGKTGKYCEADTCCFELLPSATRLHPKDNVTVTWKRPNKNGRDSDLIALYLHNATTFNAPFAYQFAFGNGTDKGVVTLEMPPSEETFVIHYISTSANYSSMEKSENIFVTVPCDPEDCSGNGVCISGACMCTSEFGGAKCDKRVPAATSLVVEAPGAIAAGTVFRVRWERTADAGNPGDYLAIFKRLESSTRPYTYVYVPVDKEVFEGTLELTAPSVPGTFQVRWISAKDQSVVVSSPEFDVVVA